MQIKGATRTMNKYIFIKQTNYCPQELQVNTILGG